jgi:hypothetical protein
VKRYFITPAEHPHAYAGMHHHIFLDSHGDAGKGYHVTVVDGDHEVPDTWEELPHLLDPTTTLAHPRHAKHLALLADINAKPEHNAYALAKHLATIHPLFKPG